MIFNFFSSSTLVLLLASFIVPGFGRPTSVPYKDVFVHHGNVVQPVDWTLSNFRVFTAESNITHSSINFKVYDSHTAMSFNCSRLIGVVPDPGVADPDEFIQCGAIQYNSDMDAVIAVDFIWSGSWLALRESITAQGPDAPVPIAYSYGNQTVQGLNCYPIMGGSACNSVVVEWGMTPDGAINASSPITGW